jgi:hypothetical protein
MQTKNYTTDLLPLIKALCGVEFSAVELPWIKALINSRAKRAYRASPYWPRFLVVGESRVATSGVIPFTEGSLDDIDTFIHINRTQPYQTATSQLIEFDVTSSGATLLDGNLNLSAAFVTYKKQLQDVYGDGSSGTAVLVPDEWFEYLAHGTYADFLRSEGQQEKAALADQEAMEKLADEMTTDNFIHTINKVSNQRIHTHGNSTTRW